MNLNDLIAFAQEIEGPYKWYILGGIIVLLTAFLTKFVFRTLKWFVLVAALAFIIYYIWASYSSKLDEYLPKNISTENVKIQTDTLKNIQAKIIGP